ncbi:MAG: hypothetical protein NZZ41_03510 [Candidatus Dojkabacteria bacterium]|nr:hypothetical protein [Candidatus Dojkabacteria bacterium]
MYPIDVFPSSDGTSRHISGALSRMESRITYEAGFWMQGSGNDVISRAIDRGSDVGRLLQLFLNYGSLCDFINSCETICNHKTPKWLNALSTWALGIVPLYRCLHNLC